MTKKKLRAPKWASVATHFQRLHSRMPKARHVVLDLPGENTDLPTDFPEDLLPLVNGAPCSGRVDLLCRGFPPGPMDRTIYRWLVASPPNYQPLHAHMDVCDVIERKLANKAAIAKLRAAYGDFKFLAEQAGYFLTELAPQSVETWPGFERHPERASASANLARRWFAWVHAQTSPPWMAWGKDGSARFSVLDDVAIASATAIEAEPFSARSAMAFGEVLASIELRFAGTLADSKTDNLPENRDVIRLAKEINRNRESGRTNIDIARQFTESNERKAKSLLRELRRFPHLLH